MKDGARTPQSSIDSLESLANGWKAIQADVESGLHNALTACIGTECPNRLRDAIAYSLLSPGKRLRPLLCILASQAVGGSSDAAMPSAAALEMIHAYSLIHDDLPAMDDDDLRRGRPTCHKQFCEATAILAGDALQPMAFEMLSTSGLPPTAIVESVLVLARAAGPDGMVGGQMADLQAETRDIAAQPPEVEQRTLDAIHRRKTGALITAAVELGAIAGGASPEHRAALRDYGQSIGIAFQIVDDLLDVEGTPENTGKATGKDSGRGKLTFPAVYGVASSRDQAHRWIERASQAIAPLGESAQPLNWLAKYILERSH